ncbi:MAG TPA: 6,7-dimethyl-8-ribityllumazine synthase [Gemmatimonadota bacterium]|jgi:6,7-dimethyl-8-ribityllumazine synthase|nr:6,7-dimethyl-8-ribityllumazine synthase [Gemmatimonadota bacterium]
MGTSAEQRVSGTNRRVALVVARYNEEITRELAAGARAALLSAGVAEQDIYEYQVAGAFELAPACRQLIAVGPEVDAVVALGAIVRGETPHFDFVAEAAARGLQQLAGEINVALAFGVLTTDTLEQAEARADRAHGDKGGEAARAALEQAELYDRLREGRKSTVRGFRLS